MKKIFLGIAIGALLFFAANVDSEAKINFGVKSLTFHNSIIPLDHSMGSYFGANLSQNLILVGGLDYGRMGLTLKVSAGQFGSKQDMSFSYLMPHAGLKLYIKSREKGAVSPYLLGEVVKSFGSADLGDLEFDIEGLDIEEGEVEDRISELLSPLGIVAGFGSEYSFSESFGIGGEVGLRLLFTSTESSQEGYKIKLSLNEYFIYSGFTLNFCL
jgi:hypothetical protein